MTLYYSYIIAWSTNMATTTVSPNQSNTNIEHTRHVCTTLPLANAGNSCGAERARVSCVCGDSKLTYLDVIYRKVSIISIMTIHSFIGKSSICSVEKAL